MGLICIFKDILDGRREAFIYGGEEKFWDLSSLGGGNMYHLIPISRGGYCVRFIVPFNVSFIWDIIFYFLWDVDNVNIVMFMLYVYISIISYIYIYIHTFIYIILLYVYIHIFIFIVTFYLYIYIYLLSPHLFILYIYLFKPKIFLCNIFIYIYHLLYIYIARKFH